MFLGLLKFVQQPRLNAKAKDTFNVFHNTAAKWATKCRALAADLVRMRDLYSGSDLRAVLCARWDGVPFLVKTGQALRNQRCVFGCICRLFDQVL